MISLKNHWSSGGEKNYRVLVHVEQTTRGPEEKRKGKKEATDATDSGIDRERQQ